MKFSIPQIGTIDVEKIPNILHEILKFLGDISNGRLSLRDNVSTTQTVARIQSGVEVIVPHGLKSVPSFINLVNGRVALFAISNKTDRDFVVLAKLLSTFMINTTTEVKDRFQVQDPTLFAIGDRLNIGIYTVTIKNIQDDVFTINKNILLSEQTTVSLALENCTFFLM